MEWGCERSDPDAVVGAPTPLRTHLPRSPPLTCNSLEKNGFRECLRACGARHTQAPSSSAARGEHSSFPERSCRLISDIVVTQPQISLPNDRFKRRFTQEGAFPPRAPRHLPKSLCLESATLRFPRSRTRSTTPTKPLDANWRPGASPPEWAQSTGACSAPRKCSGLGSSVLRLTSKMGTLRGPTLVGRAPSL